VSGSLLSGLELGSSLELSRLILDLGFTEDNVAVRVRGLVNLWVVDNEEDVLRPPHDNTVDTLNFFETLLEESLTRFSLVAAHFTPDLDMVVTLVVGVILVEFLDRHRVCIYIGDEVIKECDEVT